MIAIIFCSIVIIVFSITLAWSIVNDIEIEWCTLQVLFIFSFIEILAISILEYRDLKNINNTIKEFEDNKTITYIKPTITILEENDQYIRLLIDNKLIKEYSEHRYYITDNIIWQIESYGDDTNKTLVYRKLK